MAVRGGIWGDSVGNEEEGALRVFLGLPLIFIVICNQMIDTMGLIYDITFKFFNENIA